MADVRSWVDEWIAGYERFLDEWDCHSHEWASVSEILDVETEEVVSFNECGRCGKQEYL